MKYLMKQFAKSNVTQAVTLLIIELVRDVPETFWLPENGETLP
jgi:hypothetical protein